MGVGAAGAVAIAASVASIAGAGVAAYGSIQQGRYSAQVARNNAQIASKNANYATQAGVQSAGVQSMENAATYGQLKADQAANNVDVNSGSDLSVDESAKVSNQLSTDTVMHNALLSAYGYNVQSQSDTAQASQDQTAGYIDAATGLLGSASSISGKWTGAGGTGGAAAAQEGAYQSSGLMSSDSALVAHQGG
jgi:hypothetical protein